MAEGSIRIEDIVRGRHSAATIMEQADMILRLVQEVNQLSQEKAALQKENDALKAEKANAVKE